MSTSSPEKKEPPRLKLDEQKADGKPRFVIHPKTDDVTFSFDESIESFAEEYDLNDALEPRSRTIETTVPLDGVGEDRANETHRLTAVSCDQGNCTSITVRLQHQRKSPSPEKPEAIVSIDPRLLRHSTFEGFQKDLGEFALQRDQVTPQFVKLLFGTSPTDAAHQKSISEGKSGLLPEAQGLIVVAGATGTSKTQYALGLVLRYLFGIRAPMSSDTRLQAPHLVTVEDPPENWKSNYAGQPSELSLSPRDCHKYGIRFTPRRKGPQRKEPAEQVSSGKASDSVSAINKYDVDTLENAARTALRQTPACFFIGEIREKDDWKAALKLAGTGHLVATTTHSGSLTETLSNIFHAAEAKTAAERGFVVDKIHAIIHLTRVAVGGQSAVLPTVWLGKDKSRNAIVCAGLSGISADGASVLNRVQFIEQLPVWPHHAVPVDCEFFDPILRAAYLARVRDDCYPVLNPSGAKTGREVPDWNVPPLLPALHKQLVQKAREFDLRGL